ncbi:protein vreteno [Anopheles moucheti]|uniref:protein vreteno n=1 Tax=Anopheles moucheti TaxID=186751 RepID=UPI0022F0723A|nr:protein vreteno [Anopheles moucheti]
MESQIDGADAETADCWQLDHPEVDQTKKIVLHNVADLTVSGIHRLCSSYGTVVNAFKTHTPGLAFVEFSNETEAAIAVKQLNMKLGFNYNADLAMAKETLPTVKTVTPNDEAKDVPLTDESWERTSLKRRFNLGFSLPLLINFPAQESLATSAHYRCLTDGCLRRTDPELFFRIYKVQELFDTPKLMFYDPKELQKRNNASEKKYADERNHFDGEFFTYRGLTEEERAHFELKYCVVCKGLGFSYCKDCGTHYCCIEHQRQHLEKHNRYCPPGERAGGSTPTDINSDAEAEPAATNVLKRDPLPTKVEVIITAILTPDRIYVRSAEKSAIEEYVETIGEFAAAGLNAAPVVKSKAPTSGDIYLAMYEPLGVYGRVLVVDVDAKKSKCVFIDYGMVVFVSNDALLLIDDPALAHRKVLVYKVCLTNITDEQGEREKAVQYLLSLKDRPLRMHYRLEGNNIVDVQLQTPEGESVNDMINQLIKILPLKNMRSNSYVMYKDLIQTAPAVGNSKQIMILNRTTILLDSRITWISLEDLPYLKNLQSMLECYGKKVAEFEQSYLPREGEMCLVECLKRWYRGVCYETAGDGKPAIFLCDYGSMTLVDLSNIRKIPIQLATKAVRTHDGTVAHLDEAKAEGLTLDAMFLDIYLPENELVTVDISQNTVVEGLPSAQEKETYTLINLHELDIFLKSRNVQ